MSALLNLIPLPGRVMFIALLALGLFAAGWQQGRAYVQADWDAAAVKQSLTAAQAEADNRSKEQSMHQKLNEARNAATERENKLRADYAAVHASARGLRDTIAALRGQLSSNPGQASNQTAVTGLDLLAECADQYREVAEAADGHAGDVRLLTEAWPE